MNESVAESRRRVSRRRALALGGTLSMGALLAAACGDDRAATDSGATATPDPNAGGSELERLLGTAPTCVLTSTAIVGPYWFDVDDIRADIREDRPGTPLRLALRVQDVSQCSAGGTAAPVANAIVELWHCDAGGVYSGFEQSSVAAGSGTGAGEPPAGAPPTGLPPAGGPPMGRPPAGGPRPGRPDGGMPEGEPPAGAPGGPPPGAMPGDQVEGTGSGGSSDGSYSTGDAESATTDDGTYLRGAQPTGADGIAYFTTIFPGWYTGRTTHIHVKVHIDKKTVLTTQLYFDDETKKAVYATAPYTDHPGWADNTQNSADFVFDESGMFAIGRQDDTYLAAINLGIDR
ncbi:protocatechuate dioxygenase [Nocardia sienata]|uniref:protocatechuate dioxygenase n=1 Tax=Nocardia sienata TaxID=248552 RepID=UPI0007A3FD72|nr:protocatechuate dioxygenase [Nocardia sienata]